MNDDVDHLLDQTHLSVAETALILDRMDKIVHEAECVKEVLMHDMGLKRVAHHLGVLDTVIHQAADVTTGALRNAHFKAQERDL